MKLGSYSSLSSAGRASSAGRTGCASRTGCSTSSSSYSSSKQNYNYKSPSLKHKETYNNTVMRKRSISGTKRDEKKDYDLCFPDFEMHPCDINDSEESQNQECYNKKKDSDVFNDEVRSFLVLLVCILTFLAFFAFLEYRGYWPYRNVLKRGLF
jgi:hypothetical protein